ncbi:MAG TPA: hypothetical protein VIQ79_25860 [Kribbella sp.]
MATNPFVFNIAKGKIAYYAGLPATNDALVLVWAKNTGLEADGTLKDYDSLAALLAAANDECDFTGYARRTLSSVTVTVDDSGDKVVIDCADPASYTNTGSAQVAGAAIVCYDPDTTGGTDADLIPLFQTLGGATPTISFDQNVLINVAVNAAGLGDAA